MKVSRRRFDAFAAAFHFAHDTMGTSSVLRFRNGDLGVVTGKPRSDKFGVNNGSVHKE